MCASKIRQTINTPRINPNNTPKELSRFFKGDFWIALENMGVNNDRIINEPFTYIKQSVGFKKNYPEVIEFINSIIFEAIEDGYIKNSLQKHNVDKKLSIPKSN